jgi:predicted AlkP superfamily phosphohydrolase/phosphomutase
MRKALLIGLDCAAPELVFERFANRLPNIRRMMKSGVYGRLESCDPPITIPAWMVMVTSKSPGALGLYGFRHRRDNSYRDIWIASSHSVGKKKIWDFVAEAGGRSCLVAVPPSYPPVPIKGWLVGCFITPDTNRKYTYPTELGNEIEELVGRYMPDVEFRIEDKRGIIEGVYEMTEKRFKVVKHLMRTRDWQFFMLVEIGLDRIHHAFWKYFDEEHPLYTPHSEFEKAVENYYAYLDGKIGELLSIIDDDTVVLIASDHGGKRMKGAFCVNKWLEELGLLKLNRPVEAGTRFQDADVDWGETVAWGWGGYYARIFLNVKGREAEGIVDPEDLEKTRNEIADRLRSIKGPNGEVWKTTVLKPDEVFPECKGDPPDLMVYFDDLYWRSAGTMGHRNIFLPENDTGPDDAVHDKMGLYVYYDPKIDLEGIEADMKIADVAPTLLRAMGLPVPLEMEGRPLHYV